ncbi:MAG: alginate export family protein [Verrucomicrobiota bacterium]
MHLQAKYTKRLCLYGLSVLACVLAIELPAQDQDNPVKEYPPLKKLSFDENPRAYWNFKNSGNPVDYLKFVPFDENGEHFVSFGGLVRQRYEYVNNPDFGATPQDNDGAWLQRYLAHVDLHLGMRFRAYVEFIGAVAVGRPSRPSPVDENQLDILNGFVDVTLIQEGDQSLTFRTIRQELEYGSGRLVDVREGPNVRRTFDAAKLMYRLPGWQIDLLYGRPLENRRGFFDDVSNEEQALWGVYASGGKDWAPVGSLDAYYLGYRNDNSAYVVGVARETRHTVGIRLWGDHQGWDWNWEGIFQLGEFGPNDILAWSFATDTGYTFEELAWTPRLALSANIASGNQNPAGGTLNTFNPLFPRGNYFSEAAILGPRNFFNLHPFITVRPMAKLELTADVNFFWRLETTDGVYSPSGQILRSGQNTNDRYVGAAVSFTSSYEIMRGLSLTAIYSHFFPGDFIQATGPSEAIDFIELTLQFQF